MTRAATAAPAPAVHADAHADALGDRFLAELAARPADTARPLPHALQPMVSALAGRRQPVVVSGPSTRAALGVVGKRAASIGDRIFLPTPLASSATQRADAATTEVVAHELVHVAARSGRPRFFGGHHGAEEHRAHTAGRAMARATRVATHEHAHTTGRSAAALAVGGPMVVVRAAGATPASATTATTTATPTGPPPATLSPPVQRLSVQRQDGHPTAGPALSGAAPGTTASAGPSPAPQPRPTAQGHPTTESSTALLNRLDELMEAVEERVLAEIERRGGRFAMEF